eukprot:TRINITY_DN10347_c0_g1_i1.p1 TRINITY_DN10347_c0_g1~~TRINITY_DN10347_c0_g1_i1.p1  ORF type:complete len:1108 (+),score=280.88 TRINITY_DN10347_c0_g1_i1:63-3386(+)
MKFGKEIRERAIAGWEHAYMNYKNLKKIIKSIEALRESTSDSPNELDPLDDDPVGATSDVETEFFYLLHRQLAKVNKFFLEELGKLQSRQLAIQEQVTKIKLARDAGLRLPQAQNLLAAARHLSERIHDLQEYGHLNSEGFRKIVKKLDKRTGSNHGEAFGAQVAVCTFARAPEVLAELKAQAEAHLHLLHRLIGSSRHSSRSLRNSLREGSEDLSDHPDDGLDASELATAVEHNDISTLKAGLLQSRPSQSSSNLELVLLQACRLDRPAVVELCVELGVDVLQSFDETGANCWHVACQNNSIMSLSSLGKAVKRATRSKALQSNDPNGFTLLTWCCRQARKETVAVLLELGGDVNLESANGMTPLQAAVKSGVASVVELLLEKGADPDEQSSDTSSGETPLMMACRYQHADIVKVLLKYDADILVRDSAGEVALHKACDAGCLPCARAILDHDASCVNSRDRFERRTPLFQAVRVNSLPLVECLLAHGAHVSPRDVRGWTPHTRAVFRGHVEVADRLEQAVQTMREDNADKDQHPDLAGNADKSPQTAVSSVRQPLDVTSFIDKEGPFRARGSEKTVDISQREFGHDFLTDTCKVLIDITQLDLRTRLRDANDFELREQQCRAIVVVATESGNIAQQRDYYRYADDEREKSAALKARDSIQLPVTEDGDTLALTLPLKAREHQHCRIEVRIVSVLDEKVILARGTQVDLPWHDVDQQHCEHQLELFGRDLNRVGRMRFRLLLVTPYLKHDMSVTRQRTYWTQRKALPVWGHRGSGSSKASLDPLDRVHRTHVQENTVLSFVTAASLGAEYVEFDVQLTSDNVPVIYHNWVTSEINGYDIPVHMMTLKQFEQMKEQRAQEDAGLIRQFHDPKSIVPSGRESREPSREKEKRTRFRRSHSNPEQMDLNHLAASVSGEAHSRRYVRAPPATLQEAFDQVPIHLGFNVEIKYPMLESQRSHQMRPAQLNTFIDKTLEVIFDHAGNRNIVFSSFHPDICRVLSLKQPHYPVFFLTSAGYSERFASPWTNSLRDAVRFASQNHLLGIVTQATPIVKCPELVRQVKAEGMLLLTWGSENNVVECCRLQEACGVDAVITDHVAHVRKGLLPKDA